MTRRPRRRGGFTLVEVLAALTIGLVILAAATSFAINTWLTQSRGQASDDIARRARYLGLVLGKDIGEAGALMASRSAFSPVAMRGDTVAVLQVPSRIGAPTPTYRPIVGAPPAAGQGTCGSDCITVRKNGSAGVEIQAGELFLVEDQGTLEKRVLLATAVSDPAPGDSTAAVTIRYLATRDSIFRWPSRLDASITWSQSLVSRLALAAWYRDTTTLYRATAIGANGAFTPTVFAAGVSAFSANYVFTDGTEAGALSPASATQSGCQVAGLRLRATLVPDRPADPRAASTGSASRDLEWVVSTRNVNVMRRAARAGSCL